MRSQYLLKSVVIAQYFPLIARVTFRSWLWVRLGRCHPTPPSANNVVAIRASPARWCTFSAGGHTNCAAVIPMTCLWTFPQTVISFLRCRIILPQRLPVAILGRLLGVFHNFLHKDAEDGQELMPLWCTHLPQRLPSTVLFASLHHPQVLCGEVFPLPRGVHAARGLWQCWRRATSSTECISFACGTCSSEPSHLAGGGHMVTGGALLHLASVTDIFRYLANDAQELPHSSDMKFLSPRCALAEVAPGRNQSIAVVLHGCREIHCLVEVMVWLIFRLPRSHVVNDFLPLLFLHCWNFSRGRVWPSVQGCGPNWWPPPVVSFSKVCLHAS